MSHPIYYAIRENTATSAGADAVFEQHIKAFQEKNSGSVPLARTDILKEKEGVNVQAKAQVLSKVWFEPYTVATSAGLGTLAARANSADAGLAYCYKIKEEAGK